MGVEAELGFKGVLFNGKINGSGGGQYKKLKSIGHTEDILNKNMKEYSESIAHKSEITQGYEANDRTNRMVWELRFYGQTNDGITAFMPFQGDQFQITLDVDVVNGGFEEPSPEFTQFLLEKLDL